MPIPSSSHPHKLYRNIYLLLGFPSRYFHGILIKILHAFLFHTSYPMFIQQKAPTTRGDLHKSQRLLMIKIKVTLTNRPPVQSCTWFCTWNRDRVIPGQCRANNFATYRTYRHWSILSLHYSHYALLLVLYHYNIYFCFPVISSINPLYTTVPSKVCVIIFFDLQLLTQYCFTYKLVQGRISAGPIVCDTAYYRQLSTNGMSYKQ